MKRTVKSAFAALGLCAALALSACNQSEPTAPQPVAASVELKSYIGFSGDCYKETPQVNVQRCLQQSTRH